MPKKLSQTERIKRLLLKKGIDYPTEKVVADLAAAGCETTAASVYNTRSLMRRSETNGEPAKPIQNGYTPKSVNAQPLRDHIVEVLRKGKLTATEIAVAVKTRGFKTNSQDFSHSVRMECERQVAMGRLTRHNEGRSVLYGPPVVVVSETKSVEPATTLGIDTVNLSDLLSVQRLVRQIGGSDKLQQHVKLLEELETKPASELLERFATLVPATN